MIRGANLGLPSFSHSGFPRTYFLKKKSCLPADLFLIVWSWTFFSPLWESHLPKSCFLIYANTGGSLFRHAFFKICKEELSYFSPYGISKALLKHLWSSAKLLQPNHMGRSSLCFWIFSLNDGISFEGELLLLLDPSSRRFNSCQLPWLGNRRTVTSRVSLLTWKMLDLGLSCLSHSFFALSLILLMRYLLV